MAGKWAVWSIRTESWVYDHDHTDPVRYDTRREAADDLKAWCIKGFIEHYEVRKYGSSKTHEPSQ